MYVNMWGMPKTIKFYLIRQWRKASVTLLKIGNENNNNNNKANKTDNIRQKMSHI